MLVFRSGRHLVPAVAALRTAYPGYRLVVVTQPGTDAELREAGVADEDRFLWAKGRFSPVRFLFSRLGWETLRHGFARAAVLWNDGEGHGQSNVTWTASIFSRGGVIPVTPDGVQDSVGWSHHPRAWTAALVARLAVKWNALRTRVEGPELEAPVWHSHHLSLLLSVRAIPALANRLTGLVVDIGAGTGFAGHFLNAANTRYLPTDLPSGRDSDDEAISHDGMRPRIYCSGAALPFREGSVDNVMAVSVLEHVRDVPSILRDAYRVLRPGGRALIVTPFCFPFHGSPDDYRRWTDEGLAAELQACGFETEKTERIGSTLSSLVLNLHFMVKYEWRDARSPLLRLISTWGWPLILPWQAVTNAMAAWLDSRMPASCVPMSVAIVARKPQ